MTAAEEGRAKLRMATEWSKIRVRNPRPGAPSRPSRAMANPARPFYPLGVWAQEDVSRCGPAYDGMT